MNSVLHAARGSWGSVLTIALLAIACSSSSNGSKNSGGASGSASNGANGGTSSGHAGASNTSTGGQGVTMTIPTVPGEVDPNAPAGTPLPPVPSLVNVSATAVGDSVSISFDPIDGAVDYRVYALPANSDVSSTSDGHVTVKNAIYRCAGNRQAPAVTMDGAAQVQSGAVKTLVDGQSVDGYTRSLAEATLGYVYAQPGDGRIPVYALGDGDANGDDACYFMRWGASRVKKYVTSTTERDQLLKSGSRDDGIAFYVPAAAGAGTEQISMLDRAGDGPRLYFVDGSPEAAMRTGATAAFFALAAATDGAVPLMRVFYANACGASHDELVADMSRFNLVRKQGDTVPVFNLHWSGLTGPTTLVVEALDQGCPYTADLAAQSAPGYNVEVGALMDPYPAWVTLADAQAAAPTGEVFINGQYDGNPNPRPIARSFVKISPAAAPDLDWSYGFKATDTLGPFMNTDCGDTNCFQEFRQVSTAADVVFMYVETPRWAQTDVLGELWVNYADLGADVNGKFRLTPTTKGDMTADSFLYATMEVNDFTTERRYPQILISDQDAPVQLNLTKGNTLVVQTFGDWPSVYQLEVCDHRYWDVNNQCPAFDFYHFVDPTDSTKVTGLAPNDEVGEHVGMDRSTRFEIYVSTQRMYLMLDGQPYGCADLPASGVPSGAATVTFGDVLYHSDADNTFDYTGRHLQHETFRHFDNLGFKSHVAAPVWDESRFPCTSNLSK